MRTWKKLMNRLMILGVITSLATPIYAIVEDHTPTLEYLGCFGGDIMTEDGVVAEIVKYNDANGMVYLINGAIGTVDIFPLVEMIEKEGVKSIASIDIKKYVEAQGFVYGDITSIDIHPDKELMAVAVQHGNYKENGCVVLLNAEGKIIQQVEVGSQPDMLTFTPDGEGILVANEGEPRYGYGEGIIDPKGSISMIDMTAGLSNLKVDYIGFESFDAKRDELIAEGVLLKSGSVPSDDVEPEYIVVSEDSKTAYVALQEANAIATIDLTTKSIESIKGLGFKNHNLPGNALDLLKDNRIGIKNEDVYGVYMPDGIAMYTVEGKAYVVTANEGDGRDYVQKDFPHIKEAHQYSNEKEVIWGQTEEGEDIEVKVLDTNTVDGLDKDKQYIYGARSFSIFDAESMELVWDSGSDFEAITARCIPEFFNTSNSKIKLDDRSGKKGPEPEGIEIGYINGSVYAYIGLERIGGVMMYDITNPYGATYKYYINTRDFSDKIAGDSAPEGMAFIDQEKSPTGEALLLVANEASGTVVLFQVNP